MNRNTLLALCLALVLVIAAGFALPVLQATIAWASVSPASPANVAVEPVAVPRLSTLSDLESLYEGIYTEVNPSVVKIDVVMPSSSTQGPQGRSTPVFPFGSIPDQQALGSGFVWDTQGHIVTNNHVVEGASEISVTFYDGTIVDAKLVGADPDSDLAVIQATAPAGMLHPVTLADSSQVKVGQLAIAIGNPFGEQNTMTTGIISALGRSLPSGRDATGQGGTYQIPDVIQTDTPINPGNSGGVLLNAQGQVLGVTAAIESGSGSSAGIGFAIPSAIVKKVVPVLITSGKYTHPYLGISGTTMTPALAKAMGYKSEQRGALVGSVTTGGPAAKAGVQGSTKPATISGTTTQVGGDVITAIDNQPVKTFDDIVAYLARSTQVNQTVTLTILREGKEQSIQVTLAARPTSS